MASPFFFMPRPKPFNAPGNIQRITAAFGESVRLFEQTEKGYYGMPTVEVSYFYAVRRPLARALFYAQGCLCYPPKGVGNLLLLYHKRTEETDSAPGTRKARFIFEFLDGNHPALPIFLRALYCLNFDLSPLEAQIGFSLSQHEKLEYVTAYNEQLNQLKKRA